MGSRDGSVEMKPGAYDYVLSGTSLELRAGADALDLVTIDDGYPRQRARARAANRSAISKDTIELIPLSEIARDAASAFVEPGATLASTGLRVLTE